MNDDIQKTNEEYFVKTPPGKLFFKAAIPGAVGMLASAVYSLFEGAFVGKVLGTTTFAALQIAFPYIVINFSIADLLGVGSSVPISIALGQKDDRKANVIFTCAVIMILAAAVIVGLGFYLTAPFLVSISGAAGEVAEQAIRYFRVYSIFSPMSTIIFATDNYLRICGKPRKSMLLNLLMSGLSFVLLFLFVYVFRWGITGAALGVTSSFAVCAVIAMVPFLRGRMQLRFCRPRFTRVLVREVFACGTPSFLNNIAGQVSQIVFNSVLLSYGGEEAIAIYGMLMYANEMVRPLLYGMCDALQPAIGYNLGAEEIERVKALRKYIKRAAACLCISVMLFMQFFPKTIAGIFLDTGDAELIAHAAAALKLYSLGFLVSWYGVSTQSFLSAVEYPKQAALIALSNAFFFPMLFVQLLRPLNLTGMWLNMPCTALCVAVFAFILIRRITKTLFR